MPTVARDGVSIHFEDEGTGPVVVLLHGIAFAGDLWSAIVGPVVEAGWRAVTIDLRGHGASGPSAEPFDLDDVVDDVEAVLDSLGVDEAVCVGNCAGGHVALRFALAARTRVRGLVLSATTAQAMDTVKRLKYQAMMLGVRLAGAKALVGQLKPLFFGPGTLAERHELVDRWAGRWIEAHVASMNEWVTAIGARRDLRHRLGEVSAPTLVLVGDADAALPATPHSDMLAARIHGARYEILTGGIGHEPPLEDPETFTKHLLEFLGPLHRDHG
ncbi:MAG: alpha/beta hydrolase [Actinomycetota bacterium]|nr:alpha/beta hydrolase [Actinomycetota bacterium]